MLKFWNHSTTTRNYAVTFYKTLELVPWHLGLKELKKWQKFPKSLKIVKISIKLRVFSDRFFVSSQGGGSASGADGEGERAGGRGGQQWIWGQQRFAVNSGGVFNL